MDVTKRTPEVILEISKGPLEELGEANARIKELESERVGDVTDHARVVGLAAEVKRLKTAGLQMYEANNVANDRVKKLEEALRGMLLSADCTWEERNEGHDWSEACNFARRALAGKEAKRV